MFIRKMLQRAVHDKGAKRTGDPSSIIIQKFRFFQEVLSCNNDILKLIGGLEDSLAGIKVFGFTDIQESVDQICLKTLHLIKALNHLSDEKYTALYTQLERITAALRHAAAVAPVTVVQALVIPYRSITKNMVDAVGGKNAVLGEMKNSLGIAIPDGFAITTYAYDLMLRENKLEDKIRKALTILDLNDQQSIDAASREIRNMILSSILPQPLLQAIDEAFDTLGRTSQLLPRVAVRSSAIHEDSLLSFAGQYESVLNVSKENIHTAYRRVLASMYHPSAIVYRAHKGLAGFEQKMAVGCMLMINARAAGVVYTRDPNNPDSDTVFISAVVGLGKSAVDGTATPDIYSIDRSSGKTVNARIAAKHSMLVPDPNGGIRKVVTVHSVGEACLDAQQLRHITDTAIAIERASTLPQDIEFCIDEQGTLFILQSRPLRFSSHSIRQRKRYDGYEVITGKGSTVCSGVGIGAAFIVPQERSIENVPTGSVLVARHASPDLARFMDRVSAIVTETGGIAGHMATIAREFNIPTITDVSHATSMIRQGETITVDADSAYVYRGAVRELSTGKKEKTPIMKYTPLHDVLRKIGDSIIPLNLTDPRCAGFSPDHCTTIHDITRYCHETAISIMFSTSEAVTSMVPVVKAAMRLPIDLHVLDIGNGIQGELRHGMLSLENIASVPFAAFMKGLTNPNIRWWEPRRINLQGFFSVVTSSATRIRDDEKPLGNRSYAVIAQEYMNFNSRVGYHFSTIDAYCDEVKDNNYITFYFQGGASEDIRRLRRVRFLSGVLCALGFIPETKGDQVMAYLRKENKAGIEKSLDMLGRLTLCSLHLDMLMTADASVDWFVEAFLKGNYNFEL